MTNQSTQSMRRTSCITNMSTTTRLTQQHQCTMDLSPKKIHIPKEKKGAQETVGMGLPAQEGICRPALMFVRDSLELKSMELVYFLVEGDVPDDLRLTSSCVLPPPEYCNKDDLQTCVDVCPGQFGAKVYGACVLSCGRRCP